MIKKRGKLSQASKHRELSFIQRENAILMQANWHSSPKREGGTIAPGSTEATPAAGGSPGRGKPKTDIGPELSLAKEAKRQAMAEAAQTSLKNMESRSLEGLGDFGLTVSRGCKQVPLRNLMGSGKS